MGYRSDGAIYLSDEAIELLPDNLKLDLEENWDQDIDTYGANVFSFTSWKWYESYDDVRDWEKFMSNLRDTEVEWDFIRIGEEHDDIEIQTGDHFWVNRTWELI